MGERGLQSRNPFHTDWDAFLRNVGEKLHGVGASLGRGRPTPDAAVVRR